MIPALLGGDYQIAANGKVDDRGGDVDEVGVRVHQGTDLTRGGVLRGMELDRDVQVVREKTDVFLLTGAWAQTGGHAEVGLVPRVPVADLDDGESSPGGRHQRRRPRDRRQGEGVAEGSSVFHVLLHPGEGTRRESRHHLHGRSGTDRGKAVGGCFPAAAGCAGLLVVASGPAGGLRHVLGAGDLDREVVDSAPPVADDVPVELVEVALRMVGGDQPGHSVADQVGVLVVKVPVRVTDPDLDVAFLVRGGLGLVRGRGGADPDVGDLVPVELAVLPSRLPGGQDENRAAPEGFGEVHLELGVHVRHPVQRQVDVHVPVVDRGRLVGPRPRGGQEGRQQDDGQRQ